MQKEKKEFYQMCRKTPCFSYGDIRHVHRIYISNGRWTKIVTCIKYRTIVSYKYDYNKETEHAEKGERE